MRRGRDVLRLVITEEINLYFKYVFLNLFAVAPKIRAQNWPVLAQASDNAAFVAGNGVARKCAALAAVDASQLLTGTPSAARHCHHPHSHGFPVENVVVRLD